MFEIKILLSEYDDYVRHINNDGDDKPNLSEWLPGDWVLCVYLDFIFEAASCNRPTAIVIKLKDLVPSIDELMRLCPLISKNHKVPRNIKEFMDIDEYSFEHPIKYCILKFILKKYVNNIYNVDINSELYDLLFEALNTCSSQYRESYDTEGVDVSFLITTSGELFVRYFDDNDDGPILRIDSNNKVYLLENIGAVFEAIGMKDYVDAEERLEELEDAKQTITALNNKIIDLDAEIRNLRRGCRY